MSGSWSRSPDRAALIAGLAVWLVAGPPLVSWMVAPAGDVSAGPHTAVAAPVATQAADRGTAPTGAAEGAGEPGADGPAGAESTPEVAEGGLSLPIAAEPEPQVTEPAVPADALEVAVEELPDLTGSPPQLIAEGRGWGHSVGLSQYGARAMARHGHDHRQILDHYYPDTEVTAVGADGPLRVGLLRASPTERPTDTVRVVSRRTWEAGAVFASFDGGDRVPLRPGRAVTLRAEGDEVVVDFSEGRRRAHEIHLEWDPRAAGGAAVAFPDLSDRVPATRWGRVHVTAAGGVIRPTLAIDIERYLRGLAEVPSTWPPAALRAQAVAARTYALRAAATGLDPACACHLGPTDHDQVFRGWPREAQAGAWLQAVADTAGQAVTREGGLVWTYYSSSHGGRTERSVDSFAYGPDDGQWPSVADPWSLDPAAENPRASWTTTISHADFVAAIDMPVSAVLDVDIVARSAGGSPHTLRIVGLLPNGLPAVGTWDGPDGRGAAAWLRRELGGDVLPSQQLTDLRVAD